MDKFNVGDKVKIINLNKYGGEPKYIGQEAVITDIRSSDCSVEFDDGIHYTMCYDSIKLIKEKINIKTMNIKEKLKLSLKPEPEKTLIKAGLLSICGSLTEEGWDALELILIEEYKEKLKASALIILESKKDAKTCDGSEKCEG